MTTTPSGNAPIKIHSVAHYRQRYNWDCGVSCVLMLLPADKREQFLENFNQVCEEEGFKESTWTIDLCYLLKRFNIKHSMSTILLGVNENYKNHGYYDNIIDKDRERIHQRFTNASESGVQVEERRITVDDIAKHLQESGPAILLVDAGLLSCDLCKHNKLKVEFRRCFGGGYRGHYILLVGADPAKSKLVYRDPGLSASLCAASYKKIDEARTASGTSYLLSYLFIRFTPNIKIKF